MEASPVLTPDPESWAERIVASLHAERDGVREFLSSQQLRLEEAEATLAELLEWLEKSVENQATEEIDENAAGDAEHDYQRRYEMALDDLRELKIANSQLQQQLAKARSTAPASPAPERVQLSGLDWESQKRHILAALESEFDENDSTQQAERLRIEEVLGLTERALADKDREIRELKRQLEEAANNAGAETTAANVSEKAIDTDAAVLEERERLRQLQEQMNNKMCQAEIEISLERAKLARDRALLEEQLRSVTPDASQTPAESNAAANANQSTRGRWMSRLGLTDADRERRRH